MRANAIKSFLMIVLLLTQLESFFPMCYVKYKKQYKPEPGLSKEEFRCTEWFWLCSKTYGRYDVASNKFIFSSEGLNKHKLEQRGNEALENFHPVRGETEKVPQQTEFSFRTNNQAAATNDQTKKVKSYFYPERIV